VRDPVQKVITEQNSDIPPDRRMQFRIGVNLGDVIHDEARVYGDGVNIAARLESIAEPGGICISDDAYRHVHGKISAQFVDSGEQQLKNICGECGFIVSRRKDYQGRSDRR
jgi:adenylate cyclase